MRMFANDTEVRVRFKGLAVRAKAPKLESALNYNLYFGDVLRAAKQDLSIPQIVDLLVELDDPGWAYVASCTIVIPTSASYTEQWQRLRPLVARCL